MNLELDQDGHLVDYTIWNEDVTGACRELRVKTNPLAF